MNSFFNILIILFSVCFFSCNAKKDDFFVKPRIAKTVPLLFVNANDIGFKMHQDTVYFHNAFFTGHRYGQYENGDTAFIQSYFNGVEEGTQKKWYLNKQLEEERFYINGKKQGIHHGWWPNGQQKFYFTVNNNEYSGEFKEWMASGLLVKWFHYNKGYEEGSQRLWWGDGTVRANYVIKAGKKYGLLGYKICENPYDSIIKK